VDVTPSSKLTILKQIGHGGFGDVYHARHRDWSEVAYKKLVVSFIRQNERSVSIIIKVLLVFIDMLYERVFSVTVISRDVITWPWPWQSSVDYLLFSNAMNVFIIV